MDFNQRIIVSNSFRRLPHFLPSMRFRYTSRTIHYSSFSLWNIITYISEVSICNILIYRLIITFFFFINASLFNFSKILGFKDVIEIYLYFSPQFSTIVEWVEKQNIVIQSFCLWQFITVMLILIIVIYRVSVVRFDNVILNEDVKITWLPHLLFLFLFLCQLCWVKVICFHKINQRGKANFIFWLKGWHIANAHH